MQSPMGKRQTLQQHAPQGLNRIEQLSDDVLLLILSLLPTLPEIARTSILSRRWRNVWHGIACLDFDATTLPPHNALFSDDFSETYGDSYIAWVNKVLEARSIFADMPLVKMFRIWFELEAIHGCHIERWISFAIANRVEKLHLDFNTYFGGLLPSREYILSEEAWYKVPSGLSSLQCLKSLFLGSVNVSKQFIEFILSNCPLLEDLSLLYAGGFSELNIAGPPPLRLRRLTMDAIIDFALNILCAPHLTSFYYKSLKFIPQRIDVPNLNDLAIGGCINSQPIMEYLKHFWSCLPQLEKLELIMEEDEEFKLNPIPNLVKLKYLKISVNWDTNPFIDQILKFIEACPVLETFAFQILDASITPKPRQARRLKPRRLTKKQYTIKEPSYYFSCLKVLELFGGDDNTISQDIVKIIINKSPHLKKLFVDVRFPAVYPQLESADPDIVEGVKAKAKELCKGRVSEVEIIVFGDHH